MINVNSNSYGFLPVKRFENPFAKAPVASLQQPAVDSVRFSGRAKIFKDVSPQLAAMNDNDSRILGRCSVDTDPRMITMGLPNTSKRHATLTRVGPEQFTLADGADGNASTHGTQLNGTAVGSTPVPVNTGDKIQMGSFEWTFGQPLVYSSPSFDENVLAMHETNDNLVLGRAQLEVPFENFFAVDKKGVSRNHAKITRTGRETFEILDLGSINGTFVNSEPVGTDVPKPIKAGDVIRLGFGDNSAVFQMPEIPPQD
jgi:pSer/pThr/pTyr-binding forkhead associated (FHA) protein